MPSRTSEIVKAFIPSMLKLTEGYHGQPFELLEWQEDLFDVLFEEDSDGVRKYATVYLEIPRKNAKSQIAAAVAIIGLLGLLGDNEPEIIIAAYNIDQAKILFDKCRKMIQQSPELSARLDVVDSSRIIKNHANGGVLKVISSDGSAAHGGNPSMVICDELHTWSSKAALELWDALTTGSGTRHNSLMFVLTTAGTSKTKSLLGKIRTEAMKNRHMFNGEWRGEKDSSALYIAYGVDDGEDYDPRSWEAFKRHNPSWQIHNEDSFYKMLDKNLHSDAAIRRLFHNEWIDASFGWMPPGAWHRCYDPDARLDPGERVVLGLDASKNGDATCLVAASVDSDVVQLLASWQNVEGDPNYLTPLDEVKTEIIGACELYTVVEVSYDPPYLEATSRELEIQGINMVKFFTNTHKQMAPAVGDFYYAVMNGLIKHDGNVTLDEHINNCTDKQTPSGSVITKAYNDQKIDAAVAAVLAFSRAKFYKSEARPTQATGDFFLLEL